MEGCIINGRDILSVSAREVYTRRTHPGVEAIVKTRGGSVGRAICTAGISVGTHEIPFSYDGGKKWGGKGVQNAVRQVEELISPAVAGMDAGDQNSVDSVLLSVYENNPGMGGNAVAAVSAAVLKAGAAALGIPLYRHIGGAGANVLPVPGIQVAGGHHRYGGGVTSPGTKPTYSLMCHGFSTFSGASYCGWEVQQLWDKTMQDMGIYPPNQYNMSIVPKGIFTDDTQLWQLMGEVIAKAGYEGKIGIQMDVASDTYYDRANKQYRGLFRPEPFEADELLDFYRNAVEKYPFVIIEDPFYEEDYEYHAKLTEVSGIQIVGDDLFTTDSSRVRQGALMGACNTVLLKVNQVGTITRALEMVETAYRLGYGVMPCESRGEGDDIADYCVGINAASVREMAIGSTGNRFLDIERELGPTARFLGTSGLKGASFRR